MSRIKTRKAFVMTGFSDVGTGRSFAAGTVTPIEQGPFGNYEAAGLVRAATAQDAKAKRAA